MRPRLLDLFCCEGGAAAGYVAAGFDVYGVDIVHPDARMQREKYAGQVEKLRRRYLASGARWFEQFDATAFPLGRFDAVHASPPCKDHTDLAAQSGGDGTGWMLRHTIDRLTRWGNRTGRPWVVENVDSPSAREAMPNALTLCGTHFGLSVPGTSYRSGGDVTHVPARRHLKRHRLFVSNVALMAPGPCRCSGKPIVGVYGTGGGGQMTRGYKATPAEAREVMGMPWASRNGCAQAIPPAYTAFLGEQMMACLAGRELVASVTETQQESGQ